MSPKIAFGSLLALGAAAVSAAVPIHLEEVPLLGGSRADTKADAPQADPEILMLERELPLAAGGPLRVEVHDADVALRAREGETARIRVYAWSRDGDEDWARTVFERADFEVDREAGGVRVTSREVRHDAQDGRRHRGFGLRVEVEHPLEVDARVVTEDGDVTATRLRGNVELRSEDGDVAVESVEGPGLALQTADGDVVVEEAVGGSVRLVTSDGDIVVSRLEGDRAEVQTSDGDIVLRGVHAARLAAVTSDGDLVLHGVDTEDGRLETSDGDVAVEDLSGALRASTSSGDVEVSVRSAAPLTLTTTDGDISIRLPAGTGFELDLAGGSVRLGGDLRPDHGESGAGRIRTRLPGGGPRIEARTTEGDVSVVTGG